MARIGILAASLVLVAGLGACGDDDGGGEGGAAAGGPSKEAYCAVVAEVDAPLDAAGQYASREQKVAAAKTAVDAGLVDRAVEAAPEEIAEAAGVRAEALRSAAGGATEALLSEEALAAEEQIDALCSA